MLAARRLARGEEPRDRLVRADVERVRLHVGVDPAHAVVDLGYHRRDVPGRGAHRLSLLVDQKIGLASLALQGEVSEAKMFVG